MAGVLLAFVFCYSITVGGAIPLLRSEVHSFFYLWYGEPSIDGAYKHWNHEVLPHWTAHVNEKFPQVGQRFEPPRLLHSPFYPLHGPYSSRDSAVVKRQIDDMVRAGITVAVLSWWGQATKPYATDTQGVNTDRVMSEILRIFDEDGSRVKVAFHLEPYPGRSVPSVREDIEYLLSQYGHHVSLHRAVDGRPVMYVYDSYHLQPIDWARLLTPSGELSIRNTAMDAVMIGLWLQHEHGRDLKEAGFDGIYSYFASESFSYGSSTSNWRSMCQFCRKFELLCVLSVGPGYNDSLIRPWNDHNSRARGTIPTNPGAGGAYYDAMWNRALDAGSDVVSITSFNEWGEGTQIEPAATSTWGGTAMKNEADAMLDEPGSDRKTNQERKQEQGRQYLDYGDDPYLYLDLTRKWAEALAARDTNTNRNDL